MSKKYRIVKGYYGYHPQILDDFGGWLNIGIGSFDDLIVGPLTFEFSVGEHVDNGYEFLSVAETIIEEYKKSLQEPEVVWEGE